MPNIIDYEPIGHAQWLEYENANGCYCSKCRFRVREREALPHRRYDRKICEYITVEQPFRFCPHCGSRMDGKVQPFPTVETFEETQRMFNNLRVQLEIRKKGVIT